MIWCSIFGFAGVRCTAARQDAVLLFFFFAQRESRYRAHYSMRRSSIRRARPHTPRPLLFGTPLFFFCSHVIVFMHRTPTDIYTVGGTSSIGKKRKKEKVEHLAFFGVGGGCRTMPVFALELLSALTSRRAFHAPPLPLLGLFRGTPTGEATALRVFFFLPSLRVFFSFIFFFFFAVGVGRYCRPTCMSRERHNTWHIPRGLCMETRKRP